MMNENNSTERPQEQTLPAESPSEAVPLAENSAGQAVNFPVSPCVAIPLTQLQPSQYIQANTQNRECSRPPSIPPTGRRVRPRESELECHASENIRNGRACDS